MVWKRPNPVTGQIVAARLSVARPENPEALEARVHRFCHARRAPYKVPLHIEVADGDQCGRRFTMIRPDAANEPRWTIRSS